LVENFMIENLNAKGANYELNKVEWAWKILRTYPHQLK
jgi:hypothetical protein